MQAKDGTVVKVVSLIAIAVVAIFAIQYFLPTEGTVPGQATAVCGNGVCDSALGETYITCPIDCQATSPTTTINTAGGQAVSNYATNVYGYVTAEEDGSALNGITIYACSDEPMEKYLYRDIAPPVEGRATSDSNGKFEVVAMPGDKWILTWSSERYPEVVALTGSSAVPSLPPEQPTWTCPSLYISLKKVGNFSTILEDVGTYGAAGWTVHYDSSSYTYTWNLEGNGTDANEGQIYSLYRETGEYAYIEPQSSDYYLKDVLLKTVSHPEAMESEVEDFRYSIVSNPKNYVVSIHDVPNSVWDDYVQFYGYIEAAYPVQMNFVVSTEATADFTGDDGSELLTIKVDDMRNKDFTGEWEESFGHYEKIKIVA